MHHLVLQICCFKQSKKCKSCSPYTTGKGKKEENQIGVHSIRAGSLPGEHDVLFAATMMKYLRSNMNLFLIESLLQAQ